MRLLDGDDASCLNLNQAQQPKLLGVNPEAFLSRKAFPFKSSADWSILDEELEDGVVPGVTDFNTLIYSLQKLPGDEPVWRQT